MRSNLVAVNNRLSTRLAQPDDVRKSQSEFKDEKDNYSLYCVNLKHNSADLAIKKLQASDNLYILERSNKQMVQFQKRRQTEMLMFDLSRL